MEFLQRLVLLEFLNSSLLTQVWPVLKKGGEGGLIEAEIWCIVYSRWLLLWNISVSFCFLTTPLCLSLIPLPATSQPGFLSIKRKSVWGWINKHPDFVAWNRSWSSPCLLFPDYKIKVILTHIVKLNLCTWI